MVQKECKKCGEKIATGANFCPKCGGNEFNEITAQVVNGSLKKQKKLSGKKKLVIIGIAILFIIIIGVLSKNGDDSNSQSELNAGVNSDNNVQTSESLKSPSFEKIYDGKLSDDAILYDGAEWSDYYKEDDRYGIIFYEKGFDTGNIYTNVYQAYNSEGERVFPYYVVSVEKSGKEIETLNNCGLLDENGNEIIPFKYSKIEVLNERYAIAYEIVEDGEGNGIHHQTINETHYENDIHTVDLATGEILWTNKQDCEGDGYVAGIKGDYFVFDGSGHYEKANGVCLPEGATIFDNGNYVYDGAVYDTKDKKLFTYDENDYVPIEMIDDYYIASKTEGDNVTYIILDESGERVSAVLPGIPSIYGDLLFIDGQVYDFDGNKVIEGTYDRVFYDSSVDGYWVLINILTDYYDFKYTCIDRQGNIIYEYDEIKDKDSGIKVAAGYPFVICNLTEEKVFCFKDNAFTISATPFMEIEGEKLLTSEWYGVPSKNKTINIFTGDVIIEVGDIYSRDFDSDGNMYLVARDDGMIRVYKQKS